jgi:phosphatidylserine/phosphatidylglycerophosphate/cardiolipin synthase-like enzyme
VTRTESSPGRLESKPRSQRLPKGRPTKADLKQLKLDLEALLSRCFMDLERGVVEGEEEVLELLSGQTEEALAALARSGLPGEIRSMLKNGLVSQNARGEALRLVDDALATVSRKSLAPLHDLDADPSGLLGRPDDGRLPATIDKVVEFREAGDVWTGDLVSQHEATANNSVSLHVDGAKAFLEFFKTLGQAKDFIHLGYFEVMDDLVGNQLADLLIEKAKAGVKVRLMVDTTGSQLSSGSVHIERMRKAGVEVIANDVFTPFSGRGPLNAPDHRKVMLCDNGKCGKDKAVVAMSGGMNIAEPYLLEWHDLMIGVRGDAVHQMQCDFLMSWLHRGGKLDPELSKQAFRDRYFVRVGDVRLGSEKVKVAQHVPFRSDEIRRGFLQLINEAQHSIFIETPYLTCPEIKDALCDAARRGVDVRIVVPARSDRTACKLASRKLGRDLMLAGARVYEFRGYNHGKLMLVDGERVVIGSSNLDGLSLSKIFEMNLNIRSKKLAKQVREEIFDLDLDQRDPDKRRSDELSVGDVSLWERIGGTFCSSVVGGFI